jgi:hypothetical protein
MSDETKQCALDAAVERKNLLPASGNPWRWIAAILSGCEVFHRRIFCSQCVTGVATSRGYLALLRFWR